MLFLTINGVLLNAAEIKMARTSTGLDPEGGGNVRVYFARGGHAVVPDISVEQLQERLTDGVKSLAPF